MRLRIRCSGSEPPRNEVHRLALENNCTLQQLRNRVKAELCQDGESSGDPRLSLNKKVGGATQ